MHIYFYTGKAEIQFVYETFHIHHRMKILLYCVTHICLQSLLQNKTIYPPPPPLKQNCDK